MQRFCFLIRYVLAFTEFHLSPVHLYSVHMRVCLSAYLFRYTGYVCTRVRWTAIGGNRGTESLIKGNVINLKLSKIEFHRNVMSLILAGIRRTRLIVRGRELFLALETPSPPPATLRTSLAGDPNWYLQEK